MIARKCITALKKEKVSLHDTFALISHVHVIENHHSLKFIEVDALMDWVLLKIMHACIVM